MSNKGKAKRREQLSYLARIMSTPDGREYFYNLLASCHIYSSSFGTNALAMAFNEGERNIGLRITTDLMEASSDLYLAMLKENSRERNPTEQPDTGTGFTDSEPDADNS